MQYYYSIVYLSIENYRKEPVTYPEFFRQTGTFFESSKAPPSMAPSGYIFQICVSKCSKNLFLDFL